MRSGVRRGAPERGEGHGEPKLSFSYQALHGIVLGKSEDRNIDFGPLGARPSGVRLFAVRLSAVRLSGVRRSEDGIPMNSEI